MNFYDLPDNKFFVPENKYKNLSGLFIKCYMHPNNHFVVCKQAPYFDRVIWLASNLQIKKFDSEVISYGT